MVQNQAGTDQPTRERLKRNQQIKNEAATRAGTETT